LNAYSHWAINDEFERTAPTLVFLLMLGCRLVVDWQMLRKDRKEQAEKYKQVAAAANSTAGKNAASNIAAAVAVGNTSKRKKED